MAVQVKMPQPGNTVTECLLACWRKNPGEVVRQGEVIAEIESDKATFEIESPENGVLLGTFYKDGEVVPVHTPIGVVGQPGETFEAASGKPSTVESASHPQAAPLPEPSPSTVDPRCPPPRLEAALPPNTATRISPRAAKYASLHQVSIARIQGSGPQGRIIERDVMAAQTLAPQPSAFDPRPSILDSGLCCSDAPGACDEATDRRRTVIARRMRESLATTAQFTLNASAEATVLLKLRSAYKEAHEKGGSPDVNLNELLMYATVQALQAVPELNATVQQGKYSRHVDVNLGFACDTPQGLLVPVIKKCQELGLIELSAQVRALARACREDALAPGDLLDGTFTVSNLGNYGIESFTPIINPPQVAILGINYLQLRPVRVGDQVQFREFINLSLTCDHQVIDGVLGARFLKSLREIIEHQDSK
jgi:pyruvate dehydrogenase E2 component (dihydrolipoamide acetyltransferase)